MIYSILMEEGCKQSCNIQSHKMCLKADKAHWGEMDASRADSPKLSYISLLSTLTRVLEHHHLWLYWHARHANTSFQRFQEKNARQEHKEDSELVKGGLNEHEVKSAQPRYTISTLWWEREIITIDVGTGHAEDKRGPVHYCSCSYWRLPLQQWCNPIIAAEWITDMPCIQIDRARGSRCRWIALILYLCLMNKCRSLAANPDGGSETRREGASVEENHFMVN